MKIEFVKLATLQLENSQYCQYSFTLKELQGLIGGMSNKLVTITSEFNRIVTLGFSE